MTSVKSEQLLDPPETIICRSLPPEISPRSQCPVNNWSGVPVHPGSFLNDESEISSNDSGAPSSISSKSDQSMDPPNAFKRPHSPASSYISMDSNHSDIFSDITEGAGKGESHNALMIEECVKCSLFENVMKDTVSIPCGDTFCKTCIQKHLNEDCSCPNCSTRFERILRLIQRNS